MSYPYPRPLLIADTTPSGRNVMRICKRGISPAAAKPVSSYYDAAGKPYTHMTNGQVVRGRLTSIME